MIKHFGVTLTFDLLTPKVDVSRPSPVDYWWQFVAKSVHSFSEYRVLSLVNKQKT